MTVLRTSFTIVAFLLFSPFPLAAQERAQDHEALRGLLRTAVQAVNERKYDLLQPILDRNFTMITVDNQRIASLDALRAYWERLFSGGDRVLDRIEVRAEADDLTTFLDDNTGVSYGTSNDTYHFADGTVREMQSRWSATVLKEGDGWKIVNVHLSANLLDNPVLDAVRSRAKLYVGVAGGAGLLLGAAAVFLAMRRRVVPRHA
jgi:hypothetical protein